MGVFLCSTSLTFQKNTILIEYTIKDTGERLGKTKKNNMENNYIIRSKQTAKSNFIMIPNSIARSKTLTMDERGILIFLLSLPENWVVRKGQVQEQMVGMGRVRYEKAFSTLEEKGYIVKVQHFKGNLKNGVTYIVYESPVTQVSDLPENRCAGKPTHRKTDESETEVLQIQTTTNTKNTNTEIKKKNSSVVSSIRTSMEIEEIPSYLKEPSPEIIQYLKDRGYE